MKRDAPAPAPADPPVGSVDVRMRCIEVAAKMVGPRGPHEVIATAEALARYVERGDMPKPDF